MYTLTSFNASAYIARCRVFQNGVLRTLEFKPKPTMDDVARLAGVSTATVSRTLNEPDRVKGKTLEAVRRAVAELGYTPHFGGRALASNRTDTIGAVIPTMDNAIFARGLQALEETLAESGLTLLVASSGYDPAREAAQIRALLSRGIDGLLLIGKARPEETNTLLQQNNVPVVIAWSFDGNGTHPCVGFDNHAGAEKMANLVIDAGHRQIAMIAGISEGNDRAAERIAGVHKSLAARGLDLPDDHLIEAPYGLREAQVAMETFMSLDPRPTAIICGNDVLAAGAMMYARQAGLSIPSDVSVVGFDNIDLAAAIDPPLTTLNVPHRRMGQAAAELLLAMRNQNDGAAGIEFQTEVIVRESLGPAPA